MPTEQTETQQSAQAAIDEAARTVAEASRRTTRQAQQFTRALLDQSTEINRGLLNAWLSSTEALWRVAFEVQNAQMSAGLAWWRSLADASRATLDIVEQWDGASRTAQQSGLDAFEASARALATTVENNTSTAARTAARAAR
jgi:hypothetical protein